MKVRESMADIRRELRRVCANCGKPFAVHGAPPPHTIFTEDGSKVCSGFRAIDRLDDPKPEDSTDG